MHADYSGDPVNKYEFGPARPLAVQRRDMAKGLAMIRRMLGVALTPAFVPPYHGYDDTTLRVVQELGFRIFSAGETARLRGACLDLPARISLNDYDQDGRPVPLSAAAMLRRVLARLRPGQLNGIVFHHWVLQKSSEVEAMKGLFRALGRLRDRGELQIVLFSEILKASARQGRVTHRASKETMR